MHGEQEIDPAKTEIGGLAVKYSEVVINQAVMFPAMNSESVCTMMGTQILADYADYAD